MARRSAAEWSTRGVLALLALAIGCVCVLYSMAQTIAHDDPARAHALVPGDGPITAQLAGARLAAGQRADAAKLGRLALRQEAVAVQAASVLGLESQLRGDTPTARRWFAYSQALSRRDLQAQLWLIEDAVGRGDIPEALRHYDIALRTSKSAPDVLFPILVSASSDPTIRANLIATLARRPAWGSSFVAYAAENTENSEAIAHLFVGLRHRRIAIPSDATSSIVKSLIDRGRFDDAWAYYAAMRPGVDRRLSRDPQFTAVIATPSPLDWTPVADDRIASAIQAAQQGGMFDFSAPPGAGGPILRQVQLLPPGRYRLQGRSVNIQQPAASTPYWSLTCRDGRELGRIPVSSAKSVKGQFDGAFTVPAACPLQTLTLVVLPTYDVAGVNGQIAQVRLFSSDGDVARTGK